MLQFDNNTNNPYVDLKNIEGKFERKNIELGISDGINVEVISGLKMGDEIKVWNKTEPIKIGGEKESENK